MQAHDYEAIAICGRVFERHRGSAGPTLLQLKKAELEPSQLLQIRCNCEMLASKCCKECASEYQTKHVF